LVDRLRCPEPAAFRRTLLRWFRRNARQLPWRKTRDVYAIWVSEVMLQQTQISTVIPFYERFLSAFPDLHSLARAPLERVLSVWSGLGYYRRAENLRLSAQMLVRDFGGQFPPDYAEARKLPGVGDYTARAVLSIAYGLPYAVLDGNVARVAARLGAIRGSLNEPGFRRAVEVEVVRLLSRRQPGSFNQALMELGQTVCVPFTPACPACPLREWCHAYHQGNPETYPSPRPRRAAELRYLAAAVIRYGQSGRVGLVRGLDEGLLGGLWNFPSAFGASRLQARAHLSDKLAALARGRIRVGDSLGEVRHFITYRSIRVDLYPVETFGDPVDSLRWFLLSRIRHAAVSALARKIGEKLVVEAAPK
jgi:A/G-specific adenine glycosylase